MYKLRNKEYAVVPEGTTAIRERFFLLNKTIKTVVLPKSLSIIGNYAFSDSGIEKLVINSTDLSIGSYSFERCRDLKEVEINVDILYIGSCAFRYCTSLKRITINSIQVMRDCVFAFCENLEHVEIHHCHSIGNETFFNCKSLRTVILPEDLSEIQNKTFKYCNNITEISIPKTVKTIGAYAFSNCQKLRYVILPDSVTEIGQNAFELCDLLEFVYLEKVTIIYSYAFLRCRSLHEITLPYLVKFGKNILEHSGVVRLTVPGEFYDNIISITGFCPRLTEIIYNSEKFGTNLPKIGTLKRTPKDVAHWSPELCTLADKNKQKQLLICLSSILHQELVFMVMGYIRLCDI